MLTVQDRVARRLAPWVDHLADCQRDPRVVHAIERGPLLLDFARGPSPAEDDGPDHDYLVASVLVTDYPLPLLHARFDEVGLELRAGALWYHPDPLLDDDLPPTPCPSRSRP